VAERAWDDLVVVCATSFWDGTPLLEHHLADELSRDHPVLYLDPPTSVVSRIRNREAATAARGPGVHEVRPGLAVLSVRLPPFKDRRVVKPLSLWLTRRALRRAVATLGASQVSTLVVTSLDPLLGALDERVSVYYAKDDYVSGTELIGVDRDTVVSWVSRLCRAADVVVAVSPALVDVLREYGTDPVLIPNGCDVEAFAAAGVPPADSEPCAAFVGHLSERVDVRLLEAVARRGVRLKVIGPTQATMAGGHFDALRELPTVEWLGAVPYAALPEALSDVTTGLLPYADTAFNRASFPLKILEYLAAGRRVVSTTLPAVQWLDTPLVTVADGAEAFADAVVGSLGSPLGAAEVRERAGFAAGHSWRARAEQFVGVTGVAAGTAPAARATERDR
jgi:teichuronic acid biosynthesis glycosyltransferase TuaH